MITPDSPATDSSTPMSCEPPSSSNKRPAGIVFLTESEEEAKRINRPWPHKCACALSKRTLAPQMKTTRVARAMLNAGHFGSKEDLDSYVRFSNHINPLVTLLYICKRCNEAGSVPGDWIEFKDRLLFELFRYYVVTEPDAKRLGEDYHMPPQFVPLPTATVKLL